MKPGRAHSMLVSTKCPYVLLYPFQSSDDVSHTEVTGSSVVESGTVANKDKRELV